MPAKPHTRRWHDVQTAIATAAIVTTLGLWNIFATPAKTIPSPAPDPVLPPEEPPAAAQSEPASMPQVKIMFAQTVAPTITSQQPQQQPQVKKKKKNNGGGQSVAVTKSS